MNQFSVIITTTPTKTRSEIKKGHENIEEKSRIYFKTETQSILLKPPKPRKLKEYDADVVVNETNRRRLTSLPAKENGVQINK